MTEEELDNLPTKEEIVVRLEKEIDQLYPMIESELGAGSGEGQAAIASLDKAKVIVTTAGARLDEAFYQVGLVKATLGRKKNLAQWSAKWGVILLFYAIIWLILLLIGVFFTWSLGAIFDSSGDPVNIVTAALLPAMVGGIGGVLRSLYDLFRQIFIQKNFEPQYIMSYIVQPVMGFFLGAVAYFIIQAGFLVFKGALSWVLDNPGQVIPIYVLIALYLFISFIAGFRQRFVLIMIDKITQRLSPRGASDDSDEPVSVIPKEFPRRGANESDKRR